MVITFVADVEIEPEVFVSVYFTVDVQPGLPHTKTPLTVKVSLQL